MRTAELSAHNDLSKPLHWGHPSMTSSSISLYPQDDSSPSKMAAGGSSRCQNLLFFLANPGTDPWPLFIIACTKGLTIVSPSCPFEMCITAEPAQTSLLLFLIRYWVVFQGWLSITVSHVAEVCAEERISTYNTWNQSSPATPRN